MKTVQFYSADLLGRKRQEMDPLADETFYSLKEKGYNPLLDESYNGFKNQSQPIPDTFPVVLADYFNQLKSEALTLDASVLDNGSKFFQRYASQLLATLGFLSLPYCYAAADGAKVLYASERIRKNPEKRLLETATFVFDVCAPNGFGKKGNAVISIGKVRLMHAAIRYYLKKAGDWNAGFGQPINQEDMAGTNLAFSLVAVRGLRRLGYQISGEESLSYIKFWNGIGGLLGVSEDLLPDNLKAAVSLDKMIKKRQFRSSMEGESLTASLLQSIGNSGKEADVEPIMTYLLGPQISQLLGLKPKSSKHLVFDSLKGVAALQSYFWNFGESNFKFARKSFEAQQNNLTLKPFRLLNNLND